MKQLLPILATALFLFSCGQTSETKRATIQGESNPYAKEDSEKVDYTEVPEIEGRELYFDPETGDLEFPYEEFALQKNEPAPVVSFLNEMRRQFITAKQFYFSALGTGSITESSQGSCFYVKATWLDQSGDWHRQTFVPPSQSPECHSEILRLGQHFTIAGGYILAGAKIGSNYAGAAGIGLIGVTQDWMAGCAAGVAGAILQEDEFSGGHAGWVCGSVNPGESQSLINGNAGSF